FTLLQQVAEREVGPEAPPSPDDHVLGVSWFHERDPAAAGAVDLHRALLELAGRDGPTYLGAAEEPPGSRSALARAGAGPGGEGGAVPILFPLLQQGAEREVGPEAPPSPDDHVLGVSWFHERDPAAAGAVDLHRALLELAGRHGLTYLGAAEEPPGSRSALA